MKRKKSKSDTVGGLVLVGALILGIGLGMLSGVTAAGTLIGLGVGFVLFGLIKLYMKE